MVRVSGCAKNIVIYDAPSIGRRMNSTQDDEGAVVAQREDLRAQVRGFFRVEERNGAQVMGLVHGVTCHVGGC